MNRDYTALGSFIRPADERNRDLSVTLLLGVSISKQFIPSIANTVGTDFTTYKIVRRNQFAYGPVTSRNGDKVSIAICEVDECIISSSYSVFEIIDTEKLLPEYLMLWFKRPEFDRYARFKSHGSVREIFGWDEMCQVELPVPSLDKQRAIIKAYQTITDRIALKRAINDNLSGKIGEKNALRSFQSLDFGDVFNNRVEKRLCSGIEQVDCIDFRDWRFNHIQYSLCQQRLSSPDVMVA